MLRLKLKEKALNLYRKVYITLSNPTGMISVENIVWTGLGVLIAYGVLKTINAGVSATTTSIMDDLTKKAYTAP